MYRLLIWVLVSARCLGLLTLTPRLLVRRGPSLIVLALRSMLYLASSATPLIFVLSIPSPKFQLTNQSLGKVLGGGEKNHQDYAIVTHREMLTAVYPHHLPARSCAVFVTVCQCQSTCFMFWPWAPRRIAMSLEVFHSCAEYVEQQWQQQGNDLGVRITKRAWWTPQAPEWMCLHLTWELGSGRCRGLRTPMPTPLVGSFDLQNTFALLCHKLNHRVTVKY